MIWTNFTSCYMFLSPHQEIDGKSLLLMQRSDVLTGLSIRLGPALKIYERHVKVLQRTHFLEYEDLWDVDGHQTNRQKMLHWPKHACRALSHLDPYHTPPYTVYVGGEWGRGCGGMNFHCDNDQETERQSSYLSSRSLVFTPLPFHPCVQNLLRSEFCCSTWRSSGLPAGGGMADVAGEEE